jgi:hypothetical protein
VDVAVQGDAGLGGLVLVDQEGDPARQVGVLQAGQGGVPAAQVLERWPRWGRPSRCRIDIPEVLAWIQSFLD